ncbi:hypothetical protein GCM10010964_32530 [Caldovatus sediminis]|uniref:PhnA-like protein n=1 Tax=Caldovatus sediminis TaxID=2041189 RepID=A0A8J2ZDX7_9PROT|nr:hypothetical protein [Caldovatus sediminis]GGG42540.1 hypothetical protein GCM10010964_32530 [Caldovatus sediminis]
MQNRIGAGTTTPGQGPATAEVAVPEGAPSLPSRISWGAVFAGAVVAVAVGAMLNILGLAVGVSAIDAMVPGETPAAATFGIATGVWLLLANLIGLAVGGYVAARLSGTADDTDGVLHGLSVWAVAYLISAVLLGNVVAGTAGTAFQGVTTVLGGAARGAGVAVGETARALADETALDPRRVVERAHAALRGAGGDPAQMTSEQRNAEIAQILMRSATTAGPLPQADRDRLARLVAAEYNLSLEEAQARLQEAERQVAQTAGEAERLAREAADVAATGTAIAAYWIFAAMLLGAAAAVIGARIGTRNVRWILARRQAPAAPAV